METDRCQFCMSKLPDFEGWAVFAKVAETGSFARTAEALGLSKPTVSKAITRLEQRLGASLIHRSSRRLSLTGTGRASLDRANLILQEGEAAEANAISQSSIPRGRVRMAAPLSFGIAHLGPLLPDFMARYPEIVVDFTLSDHHVNLIAEGFDLALRIAELTDSALLSRRLCSVRVLLVGAPAYFAVHGYPRHPKELVGHAGMGFTGGGSNDAERAWRFQHPTQGTYSIQLPMRILTDNADLLAPALLGGQGLALQPEFLVWRELKSGQLEAPLGDWISGDLSVNLLMPPSPLRPLRVRVLIDYLAKHFVAPPWISAA
jgi:DNA-binding transcriptional LysR family regulator